MSEVVFVFDLEQKVKNIDSGSEGVVATCAFDSHGQIFYIEFPEKNVSNHWFRPEVLRVVD